MTAIQVELKEIAENQHHGITGESPLGAINEEWIKLKSRAGKDDYFYEYTDLSSGGYALVRGNCVLDTLMTWIT